MRTHGYPAFEGEATGSVQKKTKKGAVRRSLGFLSKGYGEREKGTGRWGNELVQVTKGWMRKRMHGMRGRMANLLVRKKRVFVRKEHKK